VGFGLVGVEQEIPAGWASAVLGFQKPQPAFVQWRWGLHAPPVVRRHAP